MIKTNRLELVKFDLKYAADLFQVWSDFEVIKYTYMPLFVMFLNITRKRQSKRMRFRLNPVRLSVLRKVGFEELDISENGFNWNDLNLDLVNFEMTKKG